MMGHVIDTVTSKNQKVDGFGPSQLGHSTQFVGHACSLESRNMLQLSWTDIHCKRLSPSSSMFSMRSEQKCPYRSRQSKLCKWHKWCSQFRLVVCTAWKEERKGVLPKQLVLYCSFIAPITTSARGASKALEDPTAKNNPSMPVGAKLAVQESCLGDQSTFPEQNNVGS